MTLIEEALRLHVVLSGDFDDGAYGRYDEAVFCDYQAYFTSRSPFQKSRVQRGKTPEEAIEKLFASVGDKQRLQKMREKLNQTAATL